MKSTIYEFNTAAGGYWRNWERSTAWQTRELIWELIRGNPYYKNEDKPRRKDLIMKLSTDIEEKKEVKKTPGLTEQDLKVYEQLNFNK